jgi:O-antigen/teichoic acid export membrane protein
MTKPSLDAAAMAGRLRRAFAASHFSTAAGAVLQMAFAAALARLLGQSEYGLFAAAAGAMRLMSYLADFGIVTLTTRRGRTLGDRTLAGLFAGGLAGSLVLAAAIWMLAPILCAWAGADPVKGPAILRALGFAPAIAALGQVATALLRHDLRFDALAAQSLGALIGGQGLVAIPLAWMGAGAWSLVAGTLAQTAIGATIALRAGPHPWREARVPDAAIRSEAAWFWALRILDSAGFHALAPLALVFAGAAQTGLWDRAMALSIVPMELLAIASAQVLFPAYAQAKGDAETVRRRWLTGLAAILTIHGAIACLAIIEGAALVTLVLGSAWAEAAACFSVLAVWGLLRGAGVANGGVSEAQGALGVRALLQGLFLAIGAAALFVLRPETAAEMALVVVAVDAPLQIAGLIIAARVTGTSAREVASAIIGAAAAIGFVAAIIVAGRHAGAWMGVLVAGIGIFAALRFHPYLPLRTATRDAVAAMFAIR